MLVHQGSLDVVDDVAPWADVVLDHRAEDGISHKQADDTGCQGSWELASPYVNCMAAGGTLTMSVASHLLPAH